MIQSFARSILAVIVALVVALFWTLELPKQPQAPAMPHVAAAPAYFAHDGPFARNPLRWCATQIRGPPSSDEQCFS